MPRWSLALAASLLVTVTAFAQNPPPPQGGPIVRPGVIVPGAQAPGMPPRDTGRGAAPQTGTAKILGRVTAADTGQPLRRAQVTLTGAQPPNPVRKSTTTDADGRFEFAELPAGTFSISASKTGFVNLQYGQRRPYEAGTPLPIADGQVADRIDFALPRGGVIVARVTDDFGEPLAGAQVQVQRYQYQADGQRRLVSVPSGMFGFASSDDRGELRMFGLMPGDYIVSASMRGPGAMPGSADSGGEGFSPTFYPGVLSGEQATPVTVRVGQEMGVQIAMIAARLAKIGGVVTDSEGKPAAGAQLSLVTRSGSGFFSSSAGVVGPDGSFTISGVTPGEHTIDVRPRGVLDPGTTTRGEGASMPVTVGGQDILNLRITTGRGAIITGRVVYEGTSSRSGPTDFPVSPRAMIAQADPSRQMLTFPSSDPLNNGTLDDNGNFTLSGGTGSVFFSVTQPIGWVLKSVTYDGRNITDEPLDLTGLTNVHDVVITLTDKLTSVSGQVGDGRGQLARDYVVIMLPAEDLPPTVAARRIRTVRPNTEGRFETRGLRPGRYVAAAVEAIDQGQQFAPDFQQRLRSAPGTQTFTIDEGGTATLDLRLVPGL